MEKLTEVMIGVMHGVIVLAVFGGILYASGRTTIAVWANTIANVSAVVEFIVQLVFNF